MILLITIAALALLVLIGCKEYPPPEQVYCSLNLNGSGFKLDNSLQIESWGRAFYVSNSQIFHLGTRLVRRGINTTGTALSPYDMTITDTQYLAIDEARERLYFAADNAICRVDFSGDNFSRLSPEDRAVYSAPALSSCGNYLTAVRNGQIARMEIQSELWTVLEAPVTATYAIYNGESGEYFYFSRYTESRSKKAALCKLSASRDSTLLMSTDDPYSSSDSFNAMVSTDCRYFAMQFAEETREEGNMYGTHYRRYYYPLNIYDSWTSQWVTIPDSFNFSFIPSSGSILYSSYKYGMADLMQMDLATGVSRLIWDGYYEKNIYSYSVSEIYPRWDGQVVHIKAWKRDRRPTDEDKSSTAPQLGESVSAHRSGSGS